jgi:hypothetical protein
VRTSYPQSELGAAGAMPGHPIAEAEAEAQMVIHRGGICWTEDTPGTSTGLPLGACILETAMVVDCPECGQPGVAPATPAAIPEHLPPEAHWDPHAGIVTWVFRP